MCAADGVLVATRLRRVHRAVFSVACSGLSGVVRLAGASLCCGTALAASVPALQFFLLCTCHVPFGRAPTTLRGLLDGRRCFGACGDPRGPLRGGVPVFFSGSSCRSRTLSPRSLCLLLFPFVLQVVCAVTGPSDFVSGRRGSQADASVEHRNHHDGL